MLSPENEEKLGKLIDLMIEYWTMTIKNLKAVESMPKFYPVEPPNLNDDK